jgi:hypothetical protein
VPGPLGVATVARGHGPAGRRFLPVLEPRQRRYEALVTRSSPQLLAGQVVPGPQCHRDGHGFKSHGPGGPARAAAAGGGPLRPLPVATSSECLSTTTIISLTARPECST